MTVVRVTENEHGVPVSHHVCEACGVDYTLTPAVEAGTKLSRHCMADECASYDPSCDMDVLFMSDAEIARDKPLVDIGMLRKRKAGGALR